MTVFPKPTDPLLLAAADGVITAQNADQSR